MLGSLEICVTVSQSSTVWRTEIECAVVCRGVCFCDLFPCKLLFFQKEKMPGCLVILKQVVGPETESKFMWPKAPQNCTFIPSHGLNICCLLW